MVVHCDEENNNNNIQNLLCGIYMRKMKNKKMIGSWDLENIVSSIMGPTMRELQSGILVLGKGQMIKKKLSE